MLNHSFTLINENLLPLGSRFVDPYDRTVFSVKKGQNLDKFIAEIQASRTEKAYPKLLDSELKEFVISSLYESCGKSEISRYFVAKSVFPSFQQTVSFAKTLSTEFINSNNVSLKQREERAEHCKKCTLHETNKLWSEKVINAVSSFVGLNALAQPESEKKLGTCGMCGCALQGKIRFEVMSILAGITPEQLDLILRMYGPEAFSKCWILKESLQSINPKRILEKKLKNGSMNGLVQLNLHRKNQLQAAKHPTRKHNLSKSIVLKNI